MGNVNFSSAKPEHKITDAAEVIVEAIEQEVDTIDKLEIIKNVVGKWYQPYCRKCPYFVNEDEHLKMLLCVRPFGEKCLAENILVAGVIVADAHNDYMRKQYEDNNGPTAIKQPTPVDEMSNELTKKRMAKIHKSRRR